jgi:hypothetical protein
MYIYIYVFVYQGQSPIHQQKQYCIEYQGEKKGYQHWGKTYSITRYIHAYILFLQLCSIPSHSILDSTNCDMSLLHA